MSDEHDQSDPAARPRRRTFTAEYKLAMVAEYDAADAQAREPLVAPAELVELGLLGRLALACRRCRERPAVAGPTPLRDVRAVQALAGGRSRPSTSCPFWPSTTRLIPRAVGRCCAAGSVSLWSSGMAPLCRGVSTAGVIVIGQVILLALGVMVTTPGVSPQPDTEGPAAPALRREAGCGGHVQGRVRIRPDAVLIEPLGPPAGMLRPGGATANNATDQLAVIDQAIGSLPKVWQAGHRLGDDPDQVARRLVVRADTAGGSRKMIRGLVARNLVFAVGMRATVDAAAVIADLDEDGWGPAYDTGGHVRDGAQVREVDALVPAWAPQGTKAIVRRERPHPGAQLRLWDHNGLRHQVTLTNDTEPDITVIERDHRGHARVENRIKSLKSKTPACPGCRSTPSTPTGSGSNWSRSLRCCWPDSRP